MAIPFGKSKVIIRQGGQVTWEGTLDDMQTGFPTCSPSRMMFTGNDYVKALYSAFRIPRDFLEPVHVPVLEEESILVEEDNVFAPRKVEVECAEVLA